MKKSLAILLVLIMAVSLLACGTTETSSEPSASSPSAQSGEPAGAETADDTGGGAAWPAEAGYFDPNYDYSQHDTFKVGYLVNAANFLYDEFDKAYVDWAQRMNINYTGMWASSQGNNDEYLSGIQTFVDQGYDGLILDPDVTLYQRIREILLESGVAYVSGMAQARDYTGDMRLYAPNVGFDNVQFGYDFLDKLIEWKDATWPDVPWDKVGVLSVDFGLSPEVHQRALGTEMHWAELHPEFGAYDPAVDINPTNYWIVDTATGNMDQVTAQNLVTQIISGTTGIDVWLIPTAVDDYSMGAANAAENLQLSDKVCTVCSGGSNLVVQIDSGQTTSWRYALFTAQSIYAEPIICELWAYMSGQTTPEAIWQEWININDKGDKIDESGNLVEEHNYASLKLPTQWIDKDNYMSYLEWTDLYAYGPDSDGHYAYEKVTDLDMYSARSAVPDYYNTPAS